MGFFFFFVNTCRVFPFNYDYFLKGMWNLKVQRSKPQEGLCSPLEAPSRTVKTAGQGGTEADPGSFSDLSLPSSPSFHCSEASAHDGCWGHPHQPGGPLGGTREVTCGVSSEGGPAWSHPKTYPSTLNLVHTRNHTICQASHWVKHCLLPGLHFQGENIIRLSDTLCHFHPSIN